MVKSGRICRATLLLASGAGGQLIWVCPSLELVVAQSPGPFLNKEEDDTSLLELVLEACR